MEIGLISCTKQKRGSAATPRNLYEPSALFRKSSEYAEETHNEWHILSAKHHLLNPDRDPIDPYDETLTGAGVETRRTWSEQVYRELRENGLLETGATLVIHAGKAYYEELLPLLAEEPVEVVIPTEGLQLGETLAWYNERL